MVSSKSIYYQQYHWPEIRDLVSRILRILAQCTLACVKHGSDFALVSGDKVYTLKGDKSQFDKFAGQNVTVKGKVDGKTLTVDTIAVAKP